ncbi:hypothetical protein Hanom_Chr01g00011301 [Helianthus anomalus]
MLFDHRLQLRGTSHTTTNNPHCCCLHTPWFAPETTLGRMTMLSHSVPFYGRFLLPFSIVYWPPIISRFKHHIAASSRSVDHIFSD